MNTVATSQARAEAPAEVTSKGEIAVFQKPRLPFHPAIEERFGVKAAEWKALVEAVFPGAKTSDAVVLALSYCKARGLDPFKRVVHIVPIWDKERRKYVETVWPGIAEHRTTAFRTKQYAGSDACDFGPMVEKIFESTNDKGERRNVTVRFPEWAQLTVYRMIDGQRVPVPGPKVYWMETYSRMGRSEMPNDMWQKRPVGQLEKCAEAAALRRAFPEELGDEGTVDEAGALHIGAENAKDVTPRPTREGAKHVADEAAADEPAEPYSFLSEDGEVRAFEDPADAANALEHAMRAAANNGKQPLEGIFESNAPLIDQFRDRGEGQYAEDLVEFRGTLLADIEEKAKRPTRTESAKPAGAAEPSSPLKHKKAEWPAWVDWAVAEIARMPQADIAGFMEVKRAEMDFVSEQRAADWTRIELAIDGRRADG